MVSTLDEFSGAAAAGADGSVWEDFGSAAAADESNDGAGNDSEWWRLLLPRRFSDSKSIELFDVGVASPFGFLLESWEKELSHEQQN